jgi:hypothetical protein
VIEQGRREGAAPLIHWKKVACGAFFETLPCTPAAKSVVFAACFGA